MGIEISKVCIPIYQETVGETDQYLLRPGVSHSSWLIFIYWGALARMDTLLAPPNPHPPHTLNL